MARGHGREDSEGRASAGSLCCHRETACFIARASELLGAPGLSLSVRTLLADVRAEMMWLESGAAPIEPPLRDCRRCRDVAIDVEELVTAINCALDHNE
jgi:hypothetical protein